MLLTLKNGLAETLTLNDHDTDKIEELNEKIKLTRPRVPPKKFIQSESELDIEKSKAEVKENTQEEIKELDKLLEEKMTDIVHRQEVMYAYVRKLDGKSLIVPVKEIKNYKEPIISSNKYKLSIKGKLDPEFVFIDYVAESEEKLKEKINSKLPRVIKTPLKFAGTASDLSDMDKPIEPKKVEDPNLDKNLKDQLQQLKKNIMEAIVGTVRDGQIYCGHNVWISIREYEESKSTAARGKLASKYSRFVKEISCNIFGTEALRTCTLIKRCSSIRLNSNPKPLLDQNKLYAVQELFSYYLETEEGKSPDEIRYELVHVGVYIASKCADLSRNNAKNETATDHSAGLFEINCQPRHNQNDATCDFVAQESISNVESWDHHGEVDEADTVDMVDMVDVVDKMDIENEINEDPEEKEKDGDFVGNDINLDDFSNTIELDSDEDIEDSIDYNVEFDEYLIIDDDLKNVTVTNDTASFTGDDRIMFSESGLTVSDVMLMLQGLNVRFGTTRSMQNALLDFIKCLAGPSFKSWNYSSYKMSKTVAPPKTSMKKVFYCSECNIVLGDMLLSEEKKVPMTCVNCEKKYEISKKFEDYFISLDLKYQLQKLLDRKDIQESMLKNNSRVAHEDEDVIKDITDGELFQQNVTDPYALSLNFSLDGAQLFKSAKKAFWPLQAHLNCLFGKTRFRHPLIVVLWQTEKEPSPNMLNLIMNELIVQCNYINKEGGLEVTDILTGSVITKPIILYCACVDSVARPIMQNRLQFNGYYGCSYCYLIGLHKEGCVRYPMGKQIPEIRDHETHLEDLKLVNEMGIKSVHGVKGESVLLTIDNFDIIWNLPPDYMHNSLMGVTKQLTMFWKSALKKAEYEKLKKRMSHVKLSRDLRRSLRSLDHIAKYKALEWKMWLLFQNQRKKKSQTPANKSAKSIEVVGNKKPNAINKRRSMDSADKKGPPPKKSKIDSNKENKIIEKNVQNLSTITELKKNEELSESSPETMPNDFNGALDNACAMSTLPSCISNETESTTDCSKKKLPDSVSKTAVNAVPNDTNNKSKLSSNSSAEVAKVTGKPTFTSSNPNVVKGNTSDKDKAIKSKVLNCSDKTTAALEAKEKEIKQLKKKLNDAKDSIERYKILLMDKHKEVQKYQQVNLDLQIKILDRVDENDSKAIDVVTGKPASEAAVGYVRKHDNQIHCGNNIYICKNSYDNARNKAASSKGGTENGLSKFVKDISTVIFGSETLKMSSVTGKPCNRYKSAAKPALDSMKLNSVYAIFKFYMSDTLQYDPVRIAQETTHVGTYIAQKIQDLNKKKRIPKKKNVEQNFYEEVIEKVQKVDEDDTDKDNYSDSGDISEKEEEEEERGEEEEEEEEEEENDDDEVRTIGSDEKND
uniref:BEN domain-containing protein n=1 Tax=Trichogramma kaykai TaxID=54128 RepID=A0ABD2W9Y4_9HYME